MKYTSSTEFVKCSAEKIDEISVNYGPKFCKAKELPDLLSAAGIDLDSPISEAAPLLDCAEMRNQGGGAKQMGGLDMADGDFRHILIGGMKVPIFENGSGSNPLIRHQSGIPFYGGIDGSSAISVDGSGVRPDVWGAIDEALEECRQKRRSVPRNLGGLRCLVSGAPGGNIHYGARLEFGGVVCLLHRNPCSTIPVAKIIYGWNVCERHDLEAVTDCVLLWLRRLGVNVERYWITRLDLQVTAGMDIAAFYDSAVSGNYRCRNHKPHFNLDGTMPEGVYFGSHKSVISLRIYDKWREAFGNSEEKCNNLTERFGSADYDVIFEPVTRVEFETHREALKQMGISTFADVRKSGTGLVSYLCNWYRPIRERCGKHTEREQVLPEWLEVAGMFGSIFTEGPALLQREQQVRGGNMSQADYRRTLATVCTLVRKLVRHECQRKGTKPGNEYAVLCARIEREIKAGTIDDFGEDLIHSVRYLDRILENSETE